jgi:predicted esterase
VLENGLPRFFRRLAEGVFDERDVVRRAHELADFLVGVASRYGRSQEKLVALGYSNGANIVKRPIRVSAAPARLNKTITSKMHLNIGGNNHGQHTSEYR